MSTTKEAIKNRLINHVMQVPSLVNKPETKLLLDWMVEELAQLQTKKQKTEEAMFKQFVSRIFPEQLGRAKPAYALAQAFPKVNKEIIDIQNTVIDHESSTYFSPVSTTTIYNGKIKYQAYQSTLKKHKDNNQIKTISLEKELPTDGYWLGLELPESVVNLNGLSIAIKGLPSDLNNQLPLISFRYNRTVLKASSFLDKLDPLSNSTFPNAEYVALHQAKKAILKSYEAQVIVLEMDELTRICPSENCPIYLKELLPKKVKKSNIIWLELILPDQVNPQHLSFNINCFPVWNVRQIQQHGNYPAHTAIIPLDDENNFPESTLLGIQNVWSDAGAFLPMELASTEQSGYSIHTGNLSVFNENELAYRLDGLLASMDIHAAKTIINIEENHAHELNHLANIRLELQNLKANLTALKNQTSRFSPAQLRPNYYLQFKNSANGDMAYFNYLMTQGGYVKNRIWRTETTLNVVDQDAELERIKLIEVPQGGNAMLSDSEKERMIKGFVLGNRFRGSRKILSNLF